MGPPQTPPDDLKSELDKGLGGKPNWRNEHEEVN
jgi:hypothetical protein